MLFSLFVLFLYYRPGVVAVLNIGFKSLDDEELLYFIDNVERNSAIKNLALKLLTTKTEDGT